MDRVCKAANMAEYTFASYPHLTNIRLSEVEVDGEPKMWVFNAQGDYTRETSMFDDKQDAVDYYNFKFDHLAQVYKK